MGVPKFFKFLAEKCPLIIQPYSEDIFPSVDNLYLDMNGIIHNCTHPTDDELTYTMDEKNVTLKIFNYIDMLFSMVKPRKYFFMGIDGVAPRAKMNQQRQRRFRAALERELMYLEKKKNGEDVPDLTKIFDSNCITPGTDFMDRLDEHLRFFIRKKIEKDSDWRKCKIVFSGHNVPGEGEHKIMSFIRDRKMKEKIANETHVMYGLDADLIMLSLASHEPYFILLREDVFGRYAREEEKNKPLVPDFELIHISILREYLEFEFKSGVEYKFPYDVERVIDDFVLICFFCGNDFLPHIPTLDIRYGAVQELINHYKRIVPKLDGYLTEHGKIHFNRLQVYLETMKKTEEKILQKKMLDLNGQRNRGKGRRGKKGNEDLDEEFTMYIPKVKSRNHVIDEIFGAPNEEEKEQEEKERLAFEKQLKTMEEESRRTKDSSSKGKKKRIKSTLSFDDDDEEDNEEEKKEDEEDEESKTSPFVGLESPLFSSKDATTNTVLFGPDETFDDVLEKEEGKQVLTMSVVDFGKWRSEYYLNKFNIHAPKKGGKLGDPKRKKFNDLIKSYLEGILWTYEYYYQGCCSWSWYYPYHYSPLPSDLTNIVHISERIQFHKSRPFHPYQQLLGVLPPRSSSLLPEPYRFLFHHSKSPMLKYYPNDFEIDKEGTKYEWEGTVIIPFIDEKDLREAEKRFVKVKNLTRREVQRNEFGIEQCFEHDPNVFPKLYVPSPFEGIESISPSHTRQYDFYIYKNEKDRVRYIPAITKGTKIPGKGGFLSFPSLKFMETKLETKYINVKVFQFPSRNATSVVSIVDPEEKKNQHEKEEEQEGESGFLGEEMGEDRRSRGAYDRRRGGRKKNKKRKKKKISENVLRQLLGKQVFVCYPIPREGIVSSIATEDYSLYYDEKFKKVEKKVHFDAHLKSEFRGESSFHEDLLLNRFGLDVGDIDVLVYVRLFQSMQKHVKSGQIIRSKSGKDTEYGFPFQVLRTIGKSDVKGDDRFQRKRSEKLLVPGKRIVYLCPEPRRMFGCCGEVSKLVDDRQTFELLLKVPHFPTERAKNVDTTNIGGIRLPKEIVNVKNKRWYPLNKLAQKIGLPINICSMLTSSILVGSESGEHNNGEEEVRVFGRKKRKKKGKRWNIGLRLRSSKERKHIVGYSRCDYNSQNEDRTYYLNFLDGVKSGKFNSKKKGGGKKDGGRGNSGGRSKTFGSTGTFHWEFSDEVVTLLHSYKKAFPEIFTALSKLKERDFRSPGLNWRMFYKTSKSEGRDEMGKIEEWIQRQPYYRLPFLPLENEVLSNPSCLELEEEMIKKERRGKNESNQIVEIDFGEADFIHDCDEALPYGSNFTRNLQIGHEVIYIRGSGVVPFGLRGIVTGMQTSKARVLFENEFLGGTRMRGDVLKTNRSQIVPKECLIDLTDINLYHFNLDTKNVTKKKRKYQELSEKIAHPPAQRETKKEESSQEEVIDVNDVESLFGISTQNTLQNAWEKRVDSSALFNHFIQKDIEERRIEEGKENKEEIKNATIKKRQTSKNENEARYLYEQDSKKYGHDRRRKRNKRN